MNAKERPPMVENFQTLYTAKNEYNLFRSVTSLELSEHTEVYN